MCIHEVEVARSRGDVHGERLLRLRWLWKRHGWPGLVAVGEVEAVREPKRGRWRRTRYYLPDAAKTAELGPRKQPIRRKDQACRDDDFCWTWSVPVQAVGVNPKCGYSA